MKKIEKNVPMPAPKGPGNPKYPEFREMGIGDSVLFKHQNGSGRAATAAKVYGYRSGKKFSSRYLHDERGVRIWRIA